MTTFSAGENPFPSISNSEWQARCELAALYRVLAYYRMTDLIDTHLTLRLPDNPKLFLINRYGVAFEDMCASSLLRITHDGEVADSLHPKARVNEAGFVIHSALHHARRDINCVIHTHTAAGIAVAAQKQGLLPISQHALKFYGKLSYHAYEGIALKTDERARLIADLGQNNAMILRNHGLIVAGHNIANAFMGIWLLERACQAQVAALAGGSELNYPSAAVCEKTAAQFAEDDASGICDLAWQAALQRLAPEWSDICQ